MISYKMGVFTFPIINPQISRVVVLNYWITIAIAISGMISLSIQDPESSVSDSVCGTVKTVSGETIALYENQILSDSEFDKIHIMKLQGATFAPAHENKCAIKVCGSGYFSSPNLAEGEGCDNRMARIADCQLIDTNYTADERYDFFNVSSISCGCNSGNADCRTTCEQQRTSKDIWKNDDECALLYQENACANCYFEPLRLLKDEQFVTNSSIHINTVVVRDDCLIYQNISAWNRLCEFEKLGGYLNYSVEQNSNNIISAFQDDQEILTCRCGKDAIPLPPPGSNTDSTTTEITPPSGGGDDTGETEAIKITLIAVVVALAIALITTICLLVRSRRQYLQLSTHFKGNKEEAMSVIESEKTYFTFCSESLDNNIVDLPIDPTFDTCRENFQLGKKLGGGHFGQVYEGTLRVAIKTLKKGDDDEVQSLQSLQHEFKILSGLGCNENVIRLLGASFRDYATEGTIYLITEYCQNGSLKEYLLSKVKPQVMNVIRGQLLSTLGNVTVSEDGYHSSDSTSLSITEEMQGLDPKILRQLLQWSEEIANGMNYITWRKVVHLDLAARNILLTHDLVAKIGDFGLSKKTYIKDYVSTKQNTCPILWVAPECLTQGKYSSKSDVWAYGVTLWEIFSLGKDPYDNMTFMKDVVGAIIQGRGLTRADFAPDNVHSKLVECWNEIPEKRPSFVELREYFATLKNDINSESPDFLQSEVTITDTELEIIEEINRCDDS